MDRTIVELARERTEDAVRTLIDIMGNKRSPASGRVAAAQTVLDRGWGKAPMVVDATVRQERTIEAIDRHLADPFLGGLHTSVQPLGRCADVSPPSAWGREKGTDRHAVG